MLTLAEIVWKIDVLDAVKIVIGIVLFLLFVGFALWETYIKTRDSDKT